MALEKDGLKPRRTLKGVCTEVTAEAARDVEVKSDRFNLFQRQRGDKRLTRNLARLAPCPSLGRGP